MKSYYQDFLVRDWQNSDRDAAAKVISRVLAEYGLTWEPTQADQDVIEVEQAYLQSGGEFWVVEFQGDIVGTAAYYPITRGEKAVEIRKMYLLPRVRGLGLGKYLLHQLENAIANKGFQEIWVETASVLSEAVVLYQKNAYQPASGVETARCDLVFVKRLY
ncbi:MAG: GNAT family N-acetyltransferase [Cyanobacteria bacterium P01_F01_bin.143]